MGVSLRRVVFVCVVALLLAASSTRAQSPNATISGIVSDPSGAVVPNAMVTLTNTGTGVASNTQTNGDGLYRLTDLIPGIYRINIAAEGFKGIVKDQVELHVQDAVSLNFTLEVGSTTESVTVSAGAPLIETESTSLGEVIEGRQVEDTPINGRNPMNLIALVPSVIPQGSTGGAAAESQGVGFLGPTGFGNYQIGGGIAGWNAVFLDGIPLNISGQNWQALVPTQDSVGEFKVDTNAVSPQYGRFAGGVVNFSTKSGANAFHGTAYEYLRNTLFDANSFFNNLAGQPRNVLEQNQFGADLGGPIIKDKTFFFFSWESLRIATSNAFTNYVPTPAEMSGDFRESPATLANGVSIDPKTNAPAMCNGVVNTICANELDPTAQAIYADHYFAPANPTLVQELVSNAQHGTAVGGNTPAHPYDIAGIGKQVNNSYQYVARVDHQLTDKQRLFARYTRWDVDIPPQGGDVATPAIQCCPLTGSLNEFGVGDTYSISPTLSATFRLGYTRFLYDIHLAGNGKSDLSIFGPNWATINSELAYRTPPSFFPGISWADMPFTLDNQQNSHHDVYNLSGAFTKVIGRHAISFGGEARRIEYYFLASIEPSGNFNFLGENGIENFVEGAVTPLPSFDNITVANAPSAYSYYSGFYLTDTFQVSQKLTLNYGVRWELPGAWATRRGDDSVLLRNAPNPLGSFLNPVTNATQNLTGEIVAVNSPGYERNTQTETHLHLFEPRLGVAYSVAHNTVLRAGFAISAPCIDCGSVSTEPSGSPFNSAVTLDGPSLSNPFPGGINLPLRRSLQIMDPYTEFPKTLEGIVVGGQEPYQTYPYIMQWNANVEHAIGSSLSVSLSYTGSRGVHLGSNDINLDQLPDQYDSLGPQLLTQVHNPLQSVVSPSSGVLAGPTANYGQFLLPYPQFTQFNTDGLYRGRSYYDALGILVQKRFAGGATFNAAYTWAHFISTLDSNNGFVEPGESQNGFGPQDFTNLRADRSDSAADVPQRLVLSYVLDLPFGNGKRFLSGVSGVVDHLVSGWSLNGITTFQTGLPLGFTVNGGNILSQDFGAGTIRPNVVPGCDKRISLAIEPQVIAGHPVFDTGCFQSPGNYAFGNAGRLDSTLRAQGINNFDVSLTKATHITERVSLLFDAEFFNIFNRVQFSPPNTTVAAQGFGTIGGTVNQPRIGQLALRLNF